MTTTVTTLGGTVDQEAMAAEERLALAGILRDAWWDCHLAFLGRVVEMHHLGLSAESLRALAVDLDEAGYPVHAHAAREVATPSRPVRDVVGGPLGAHRRRHARTGVSVTR